MELSDIGPQELLVGVFFCFLLSFRIKKKITEQRPSIWWKDFDFFESQHVESTFKWIVTTNDL